MTIPTSYSALRRTSARVPGLHWETGRALLALSIAVAVAVAVSLLSLTAVRADAAVPAQGRAWELVTPPDPNGVVPAASLGIDATGGRLAYATFGPLPGSSVGSILSWQLAVRGATGWRSASVAYPYPPDGLRAPVPFGVSKDLSTWIWVSATPMLPGAPDSPEGVPPETGVYRGTADGSLALLGRGGTDWLTSGLVGLSEDAQHIVFQTPSRLLPADAAPAGASQLYEYVGATLRLVAVDSGGALLSTCGVTPRSSSSPPNPVSRDTRRIFFGSRVGACDTARERVYLRQDGTAITEISTSRCTRPDCNAPADVRFMGATPDGSTAFLATTQQLTDDDVDESSDLYRYGVAGGTLSRVSTGAGGAGADVLPTRAYSSADGRRVYFLARGLLAAGHGTAGAPNLYVADGDGVRFVATLAEGDDWVINQTSHAALQELAVTPGGRRMMFVTVAALTPDDVDLARDVYLYDAEDGVLTRVSGTASSGNGDFPSQAYYSTASVGGPARSLSDDGRRVFFLTSESLLPEDVNSAADLYEWFDGGLGLVSAGTGVNDVLYMGASSDGGTVFFATDEGLLPGDDDGDFDMYAARLGGGFPPPVAPPPECAGEACLPPPLSRVVRPHPGSLAGGEGRRAARLRVRRPRGVALRRMAATGRLRLAVVAPRPGRVTARASARLGHRVRTVGRGHARAVRGGEVTLRMTLSALARRRLAAGSALNVRLVVRHSRLGRASAIRFTLPGGR